MALSRILIAGLRGGSGKTIVSLGLIAAWRRRGMAVYPFKKGPDFIDAGWLALAAGRPCHNLDTFLIPPETVLSSFVSQTAGEGVSVIEGNRGLYDGLDVEGSTSTAELAKLLRAPVVVVVDGTKSTRTIAALVLGCIRFDPDVYVAGVVLNRIAGSRHESIARKAVERYCDVPVLGAIPKIKEEIFPERHMGLVPTPEHDWATDSIYRAAEIAEQYLDLERLAALARGVPDLELPHGDPASGTKIDGEQSAVPLSETDSDPRTGDAGKTLLSRPRIGIIQDAAFQFYYPENIHALVQAGADIVVLSALKDETLDGVDGLYIGGGFPETQAEGLAANASFRQELCDMARTGLPVYAECGGLMYLGEKLVLAGEAYPMVGLLPAVFGFSKRPQGHGYTICEVDGKNPYFPVGSRIRGHEFHYSTVLSWDGGPEDLVFRMVRGKGIEQFRDGICYGNTLATYVHIHASGTPSWAHAVVRLAEAWRMDRMGRPNRTD